MSLLLLDYIPTHLSQGRTGFELLPGGLRRLDCVVPIVGPSPARQRPRLPPNCCKAAAEITITIKAADLSSAPAWAKSIRFGPSSGADALASEHNPRLGIG